jgi:NADH-quinone oxidoreductase subunit D
MTTVETAIGTSKTMVLNMGPQHPSTHGVLRVLLELQRISSHLVWLGTHALDMGAMSVMLYCFREREEILKIFERFAGQRMMTSYIRIGGLALEPPAGWREQVKRFLDMMPARIDEYEELLTNNRIWQGRLKGIGYLPAEKLIAMSTTGPGLRAAGVAFDNRKAFPYSSYEEFEFNVPTRTESDCFARYLVRVQEMRESVKIVRQAMEKITDQGPIKSEAPGIVPPQREKMKTEMEALIYHFKIFTEGFSPPPGEVYVAVESPRGELGCFIASDGSPKPLRVHFRGPSFVNLQALPLMVKGQLIADTVASIGTIDIVLGEVDR